MAGTPAYTKRKLAYFQVIAFSCTKQGGFGGRNALHRNDIMKCPFLRMRQIRKPNDRTASVPEFRANGRRREVDGEKVPHVEAAPHVC